VPVSFLSKLKQTKFKTIETTQIQKNGTYRNKLKSRMVIVDVLARFG